MAAGGHCAGLVGQLISYGPPPTNRRSDARSGESFRRHLRLPAYLSCPFERTRSGRHRERESRVSGLRPMAVAAQQLLLLLHVESAG